MENEEKSLQNWHIFSGFILKLIAIITMTIDHLGVVLNMYYLPSEHPLIVVLRAIGRLALPLFCFMIYEGVMHTKHFGKYALRLGILTSIISIALIVMVYQLSFERDFGNIFIDLLLGAVGIYCLKHPNYKIKLLAILPVIFTALSCVASYYEHNGTMIHWFPFFFRTQYQYYGVLMIYGFYFAYLIKDVLLEKYSLDSGLDIEVVKDTNIDINISNILYLFVIAFCTVLFYFFDCDSNFLGNIQLYAILSGALLLFYNHKRGYNNKYFQYGCYVYYPAHIVILFLIFYLINL